MIQYSELVELISVEFFPILCVIFERASNFVAITKIQTLCSY